MTYRFCNDLARQRFTRFDPVFEVDYSLGRPILVIDETTSQPVPASNSDFKLENYGKLPAWTSGVDHGSQNLYLDKGIHGTGVFTSTEIQTGDIIGTYNGIVYTFEEYDSFPEDRSHFLCVLNDGANGVAVDGSDDTIANQLKYLNHSCSPNVAILEHFFNDSWRLTVIAIEDISAGSELLHDFRLTTDDQNLARIICLCGSPNCRKYLFENIANDEN